MKKKVLITAVVSAVILAGGALGAGAVHINNTIKVYDNVIYSGVLIEDVDLSLKTKNEALKLIQQKYTNEVLKKKINIKGENKTYTIDYSKLSAKYNAEEAVNEAFNYGKDKNLFEKYKLVKSPVNKKLELKFSSDNTAVKEFVAGIQKDIDKNPTDAAIKRSGSKFVITQDKEGAKLDTEKLEKDIISKINGKLTGDVEIEAPIESVQASVTGEQLSKINTRLSSFSTSFTSSSSNRIRNISLATKSINGKVLMPGESFSFNGVVGERTAARGYKEAGVIVNNQYDSGIGGGICQVSTTLYNAIIRANINSVERSHHSLPSHYIGLGMDATVSYGSLDYKFKNTLDYPVYIEGIISGKTVRFSVYSDKSLTKRTYDLVNEVYATIKPNIKYVDDPNMYKDETETVKKASTGYKVRVYKKIYENGKLVGREKVSDETYRKVDGIVKRGTKDRPAAPAPEAAATINTPAQVQ